MSLVGDDSGVKFRGRFPMRFPIPDGISPLRNKSEMNVPLRVEQVLGHNFASEPGRHILEISIIQVDAAV